MLCWANEDNFLKNHFRHPSYAKVLKQEFLKSSIPIPWSTAGAPPCMEPVAGPAIPPRVGISYKTTRPHPWRPKMSYEAIEVTPLPEQPVTSQLANPCFAPSGMATEPLIYPNLVTGFERNPQHAARAALYTRYTTGEWINDCLSKYAESDVNRNTSERMRNDCVRLMRETDEKTAQGQRDVGRRLGERLTDITFWRNELNTELEKLITETSSLRQMKLNIGKTIQDLETPLHIAQECLYHRESRQDVEKAHDIVEKSLLLEVNNLRESEAKLRSLYNKIDKQLQECRAAQNILEEDVVQKESTLGVDSVCHQLNNYSRGINYYGGIEKYDPTVSTQDSWAKASSHRVTKSQSERGKSQQIRSDTETIINAVAQSVWDHWSGTNNALDRRSQEMGDAKNRIQLHLYKVQQELFDLEKTIFLLRKSIEDKSNPMKVAQTRLEARSHRQGIELCKDFVHLNLVQEVNDIQDTVETLHRKLEEAESQHQNLLKTKSNLEANLRNKTNALFIDREKCMGMRRSFPINNMIKY